MPTAAPAQPETGAVLRDARERAGLTQRELAGLMGVSRATVAEAEAGADLRASTMQRALDVLAALSPGRLLGDPESAAPAHSPAAWRLHAQLCGFTVRRARRAIAVAPLEGGIVGLAALGVRPLEGSLRDDALRRALLRAVYRGDAAALQRALESGGDRPGAALEIEDEGSGLRHRFRFPRALDEKGFDYERFERADAVEPLGDEGFLAYTPGHAIEELELALEAPAGGAPEAGRYEAHAGGRREADGPAGLALALRPQGVRARRSRGGRRLSVVLERPEPYVAHELHWGGEAAPVVPVGERAGERLRAAREAEGWSLRELARRVGASPMTVSNAEAGRDALSSTLRGCLQALESLSPGLLLDGAGPDREATPAELWSHQRSLHGLEAEEEWKELVVGEDGWADAVYRTRGLRSLRPRPDGLVVRYGASRTQPAGRSTPPDTIEQDGPEEELDEGFRTRLVRHGGGQVVHELRFSPEAARRGVSYTRRIARVTRCAFGPPGAAAESEGHGFAAAFPMRRLRVSVRFPAGRLPAALHAHARGSFVVPGLDERLADRLHPEGLALEVDRRARRAELVVGEPLIGVRYGLSWTVG